MKILIIINARLESTRLPQKHLSLVHKDQCMMDILILRLKNFINLSKDDVRIVLGTADTNLNRKFEKICVSHNVLFYAGCEDNILRRHYEIVQYYDADCVVNIDGDDPLFSSEALSAVIEMLKANADAAKTVGWPLGMNVWGYNSRCFVHLSDMINQSINDVGWNTDMLANLKVAENSAETFLTNVDDMRLTIDYNEDIEMLRRLASICNITTESDDVIISTLRESGVNQINLQLNDTYWVNFDNGRKGNG